MKCRWEGAPLLPVYVLLPYDVGDVFTDQTSGTVCPTGDRSELVGGAVSYRHAGENDTKALTRETWVQDV